MVENVAGTRLDAWILVHLWFEPHLYLEVPLYGYGSNTVWTYCSCLVSGPFCVLDVS